MSVQMQVLTVIPFPLVQILLLVVTRVTATRVTRETARTQAQDAQVSLLIFRSVIGFHAVMYVQSKDHHELPI